MRYLLCVMMIAMVGGPAVAVEADRDADLQETFSEFINERIELKRQQHGFHRGAHAGKLAEKRRMDIPEGKYTSEALTFDDTFVPPEDPELWPLWREWLAKWRDDKREAIEYDDSYYTDKAYDWIPSNYVSALIMFWDMELIDAENGKYKVEEFIEKSKKEFGGLDNVVPWLAYPILGISPRNQTDMHRDLPGGLEGVRKFTEAFHKHGIELLMPFQPWDTGTRQEDKNDAEVLLEVTDAINADGIYLDTWYECTPIRAELDKIRPGLAIDTELAVPIEYVAQHQMSWAQMKPWRTWLFDEAPAPGVFKSKWLERRHVVRPTNRWLLERTGELQASWMNGTGTLIWENRFGCWNGWDERAQSILRSMLPVQRRYVDIFTGEGWTPLVSKMGESVFASLWEGDQMKLWTIVNRAEVAYNGLLLEVDHSQDTQYFDLIRGEKADIKMDAGTAYIDGEIDSKGIGGILAIPEKEVTRDFKKFLKGQAKLYAGRNWDPTFPAMKKKGLNTASKTKKYDEASLPAEMAAVPATSVKLKRSFNEGSFPAKFHDTLDKEVNADLSAYAIDLTPVTNAQYAMFIKASGYKPRQEMNFLEHWVDGKPPVGKEDHPVVYVDLKDARAYAKWAGKRLPTDSEWQYAAAGPKGLEYPWGNKMGSDRCNTSEEGTASVRAFPKGRSPFGCYDMSGNTWEWTDSEQTDDGRTRYSLIRGGSYFNTEGSDWYVDGGPQPANRVTKMILVWPGLDRCSTIGFRCVVDLAVTACDAQAVGDSGEPERDRFLLLDSRIIDATENATLTIGEVQKHKANPLFEEDKPWEKRFDNLYANVIYDEDQKIYKCWYSPFIIDDSAKGMTLAQRKEVAYDPPREREMAICYATSKDGITWVKPELGITEYEGSRATNILWRGKGEAGEHWGGPHGSGVFKDLRDPDPKRRYKAFLKSDILSVAFSPDGIHWDKAITCPEADSAGDTHNNAFWAPTLGKYVGITRQWAHPNGRQVARTVSEDFIDWKKCEIVLEGLNPRYQTYAMPVFFHGGIYLGLVAIHDQEDDRVWTELTWSPDTIKWHRVLPGTPLIPNTGEEGDYDWGCAYAAACPVFLDNEIRLYYGGSDGYHFGWRNGFFALATLRPDGFAGYTPIESGQWASVITVPMATDQGPLRLCADIEPGGRVKVTLLDATHEPLAHSIPLTQSMTDGRVTWQNGFSFDLLEKDVRLQIQFKEATVYSVSFSE